VVLWGELASQDLASSGEHPPVNVDLALEAAWPASQDASHWSTKVIPALADILEASLCSGDRIDRILERPADWPTRAKLVASAMQDLLPGCFLYACLLENDEARHATALDKEANVRGDWGDTLKEEYKACLGQKPTASPERRFPHLTAFVECPVLVASEISLGDISRGILCLGIRDDVEPVSLAAIQTFLSKIALQLASQLQAEDYQQAGESNERLAELSWLEDVAELVDPVIHEFNNFLNALLLHVAVLEPEVPQERQSDLAVLRKQGAWIKETILQFQKHRRSQRPSPRPADLHSCIWAAIDSLRDGSLPNLHVMGPSRQLLPNLDTAGGIPVLLDFTSFLPQVVGPASDLQRLCAFLLRNAAAVSSPGQPVEIRTQLIDNKVILRVEDAGPKVEEALLSRAFSPSSSARPGTDWLELAACKSIVKRMQGGILAENRAAGGLAVVVELPPAIVT
jgi:signal transduction histidine kinase